MNYNNAQCPLTYCHYKVVVSRQRGKTMYKKGRTHCFDHLVYLLRIDNSIFKNHPRTIISYTTTAAVILRTSEQTVTQNKARRHTAPLFAGP